MPVLYRVMNDFINAMILAIVQGLSEWLPVSSSGHLVLFQEILNYHPGLEFDVALHFGTLMAVFVYFGKEIMDIIEAVLKGKWSSQEAKIGFLIIIATIPAAVIGYLFRDLFETAFTSLSVVAWGFAITGLILIIASLDFGENKKKNPSWIDAIWIGFAQTLAIFPGISRSGSTISSGLLRGLDEKSAMKFSFLMSIPVIFGAGILEIGDNKLLGEMIWATLLAFFVGLATIHILLKFISKNKKNLRWFACYALLLAIGIGVYLLAF
jgi:undecaprenyl-diphosphatase